MLKSLIPKRHASAIHILAYYIFCFTRYRLLTLQLTLERRRRCHRPLIQIRPRRLMSLPPSNNIYLWVEYIFGQCVIENAKDMGNSETPLLKRNYGKLNNTGKGA